MEAELLQPEGKWYSLDASSPNKRPFIACRWRTEMARKKAFEDTSFKHALHSIVQARQASGECIYGLAARSLLDPVAGKYTGMMSTVEAAERPKED